MNKLKVGIAGFGIVGKRRQACVNRNPHLELVAVCDRSFDGSGTLPKGIRYYTNYQNLLKEKLDILIVSF